MSGARQLLALCCECGAQRTTTTQGALTVGDGYDPQQRCVVVRKCATCGRRTRHAYLREGAYRDHAEDCEFKRIRKSNAQARACEIVVDQLQSIGVRVYFDDAHLEDPRVQINRYLDDGVYTVRVSGARGKAKRGIRLSLLRSAWDHLWRVDSLRWDVFPAGDEYPAQAVRCWSVSGNVEPELWAPFDDA